MGAAFRISNTVLMLSCIFDAKSFPCKDVLIAFGVQFGKSPAEFHLFPFDPYRTESALTGPFICPAGYCNPG